MTSAHPDPTMPPENTCPHCGAPLAAGALAGLCPACLLQQGALADSVAGVETRPFEPPTVAELASLFPQLEILELIGRGGMGAVYRARQKELDRIVALKILPPEICAAPGFTKRFAQEARALAKLNHPGIVTIHDFGRAGALFYFLMEFVDGVNLRQLLTRGRVAPREALAIVPEICDALQFAHDHGIVHRDIKPENILLDRRGRVKVADFGIARMLDGEISDAGFVETQPAGTPQYMAPEQMEQGSPDHRADIYSLGVVLYELLTGELPTEQLQPPSRKVQIDVRLDEIVLRALEKAPSLRYQTAGDFRTQMEAVTREASDSSSTAAASGSADSKPPRFSRLALAGFCLAVLSVFLVVLARLLAHSASRAVLPNGETIPGKPIWFYVSTWLVLIPGILAPIGTTILGWRAIAQIRRSAGKIHGLWLAVFDALLFPLLAWLAFVAWFWFWLFDVVKSAVLAEQTGHAQLSTTALILIKHSTGFAFLAFGVTAVLAGFFIVRRFWRRANTAAGGEVLAPPPQFPRWVRIAVPAGAISLFAMIYWSNRPAPIGQWTANRISASAPATGDIVATIEEVVRQDHFVWIRLRTSTSGLALKIEPRFDARLSAPPPLGLAQAPLRPTVNQGVVLELTPDQPPFQYAFTSRDVPAIHGPGEALIGFALPSAAAAEVAANQLTSLGLRRPRGLTGERSALLLFYLTARAAKPAENQMLHAWISFEIVERKPGQALQGQNFGPEIERVLPDPAAGVACLLDFETGNFVTPPPALAQKFAAGLADIGDADAQWLRESGADAVVRMSDRSSLRLFEGVALSRAQNQEPPRSWAQFTKADVLAVMQGATWELQQRFVNSGRGFFATPAVSPVALAFITREGNMGVLEIIGPTTNPRGVKIRYKLLPREASGAVR